MVLFCEVCDIVQQIYAFSFDLPSIFRYFLGYSLRGSVKGMGIYIIGVRLSTNFFVKKFTKNLFN